MLDDILFHSIDYDELKISLDRLSKISSKNLKSLDHDELTDFSKISTYINNLYGTKGYNLLYNEILSSFPSNQTTPIPGTVSSFFLGCSSSNFPFGSECSLPCLTGAPSFQDSADHKSCSYPVFISPYDDGYSFTQLSLGDFESTTAIIYIVPPFYGFIQSEIFELSNKNITHLIIIFFNHQTSNYSISDTIPLSLIPIRHTNKLVDFNHLIFQNNNTPKQKEDYKNIKKSSTNPNSYTIIIIAIIILFLFVISLLFYLKFKRKH
jgi:hypothetical protein